MLCMEEPQDFLSLPDISRPPITKRKGQAENVARMADSHEGIQAENRKRMDKLDRLDVDCSMILKPILEKMNVTIYTRVDVLRQGPVNKVMNLRVP